MYKLPSDAPPENSLTFDELRQAMTRGSRLCSACRPIPGLETNDGSKYWLICVARLPAKNGAVLPPLDPVAKLIRKAWGNPRREDGHREFLVPDSPAAKTFFEQFDLASPNPEVHHAKLERTFIRLDLVAFSKLPEELQPRAIAELHEVVQQALGLHLKDQQPAPHIESLLHTGDGFVLVFEPHDELKDPWPLDVAKNIAVALDDRNDDWHEVHFRIAVHRGHVYRTGDLLGRPNYVGTVVTDVERLLSCIDSNQEDVVCFSDSVYRRYKKLLSGAEFIRMGSRPDKWGKLHKLYLLEYTF
jgi:class 3 adenylate cyclase